jgi:hypothetical protein
VGWRGSQQYNYSREVGGRRGVVLVPLPLLVVIFTGCGVSSYEYSYRYRYSVQVRVEQYRVQSGRRLCETLGGFHWAADKSLVTTSRKSPGKGCRGSPGYSLAICSEPPHVNCGGAHADDALG